MEKIKVVIDGEIKEIQFEPTSLVTLVQEMITACGEDVQRKIKGLFKIS